MAERRRYDKRQKLSVVMAAELSGLTVTAESTGIPKSTIAYWMDRPEFAQARTKTREDLAEEIGLVAHLAWQRTAEALQAGTIEPRDVLFAAEKATSLSLLIRGEPTSRTETRSLTDGYNDDEKRRLRDFIDSLVTEPGSAAGDSFGAGTEVRQPATA